MRLRGNRRPNIARLHRRSSKMSHHETTAASAHSIRLGRSLGIMMRPWPSREGSSVGHPTTSSPTATAATSSLPISRPPAPAARPAATRAICGVDTLVPDRANADPLREPAPRTPRWMRESSLTAETSGPCILCPPSSQ